MNLSKLPPQIRRNFWKKLAAFLLATIVWLHVRGEHRVEKGVTVPLSFSTAQEMTLVEASVKRVQVILSGPQEELEHLDVAEVSAKLDLSDYTRPISVSLPFHKSDFKLPRGADVVRIYPSHVLVTLDHRIEKTLPVHPQTVGKPAEGYRLSKITVNPTVIAVKGPQSVLEKMQAVSTQPVDLTGKIRSFLERVPLKWSGEWGDPHVREKGVEVLISIEPHLAKKKIVNVELLAVKGLEDKRVLDCPVKKVSLWVQGTEEVLKLLRRDDVTAFLEVGRLSSGKFELPVQVKLPNGVTLGRVEPSQVEVTVTEN